MSFFEITIHFFDKGFVSFIFGGFIGFITSYFFSVRNHLSYQSITFPFYIHRKMPRRSPLLYKGNNITNIRRTFYVIWNSGNQVIRESDFSVIDHLRLECDLNTEIIDFSIIKKSNDAINFQCCLEENHIINFSFEYLNPGDGAWIQVFHRSPEMREEFKGSIIGIKKGGLRKCGEIFFFNGQRSLYLLSLFFVGGSLFLYVSYIYSGILSSVFGSEYDIYLFCILLVNLSISCLILSNRHFPATLQIKIPKGN